MTAENHRLLIFCTTNTVPSPQWTFGWRFNEQWASVSDHSLPTYFEFMLKIHFYTGMLNPTHNSCVLNQLSGWSCSLLTSCSFMYSCQTTLNERGLTH